MANNKNFGARDSCTNLANGSVLPDWGESLGERGDFKKRKSSVSMS